MWHAQTLEDAIQQARELGKARVQDMAVIELDGCFAIASYNKIRTMYPNHRYWEVPCFAVWH